MTRKQAEAFWEVLSAGEAAMTWVRMDEETQKPVIMYLLVQGSVRWH